jgi:hypothetical protein
MRGAAFLSISAASLLFFAFAAELNALDDAEARQLERQSPEFKKAQEDLNAVWDGIPDEARKRLRPGQLEWLKNGRDAEAAALIKKGKPQASAYTAVTVDRCNYLLKEAGEKWRISMP